MAEKKRIYLDTSVISAYFDEQWPERQELTKRFWKKTKGYEIFISPKTKEELQQAPLPKREKFIKLTKPFDTFSSKLDEVENLAEEYIKAKIIPRKYRDDAVHIARAVIGNADILLSWNFNHLVKLKTIKSVNAVNTLKGYPAIEIATPAMV